MFDATYERVKLLGEGAFGAAYLVRQKEGPRVFHVAKEIRISHLAEKARDAALAESEVLRKMSHSNIVAYITSFLEGSKLYIVMEYADGGDLAEKIKDHKEKNNLLFQEREIMFIFVQVSLALLHIHSRKIMHRDIKPLNIFLTQQGVVKLGDFGIAKVLESETAAAGTMIGTPSYLSPEIINNDAYGKKSDLWSLGVVTYELSVLRTPFSGMSVPAIAMKIIGADPDPLPEDFSVDLKWIVLQLLQKEPDNRPRLDRILQISFVQGYIQLLHSHTITHHSGGCEAMVVKKRTGRGHAADPVPAIMEEPPARREENRQRKAVEDCGPGRGAEHGRAGSREVRHETDRDARHRQRKEELFREGKLPSRDDLRGDHRELHQRFPAELPRAGSLPKERRERQEYPGDRELVEYHRGGCQQVDIGEMVRAEFSRNREMAAQVKRRYEDQQASIMAPEAEERSRFQRSQSDFQQAEERSRFQRSQSDFQQDNGERRKAEVRRKAQEEREQQEALQRRALSAAMREQDEDRRRIEQSRRQRESPGQATDRSVENEKEDYAQTLPLGETVFTETIAMDALGRSSDIASDTVGDTQVLDGSLLRSQGLSVTNVQDTPLDSHLGSGDKSLDDELDMSGFNISFTNGPRRAKPKLSSQTKTRSAPRSELRELPAERSYGSTAGSCPRIASGGPDSTQRKHGRAGTEPPARLGADSTQRPRGSPGPSSRQRAETEAANNASAPPEERYQKCLSATRNSTAPEEHRQKSPRKSMPVLRAGTGSQEALGGTSGGERRPPRPPPAAAAAGAPARWLRNQPSAEPVEEELDNTTLGADAWAEGSDGMNITMDWNISEASSTIRAPLPNHDVSQLADALQQALCDVEGLGGTISGKTLPDIPEDLGSTTLGSTIRQEDLLPPTTIATNINNTGVSVLSDWLSDNEDDLVTTLSASALSPVAKPFRGSA